MAFPASTITPAKAWDEITSRALRIQSMVQRLRDLSAAGPTGRTSYIQLQKALDDTVEFWNARTGVPGLQAYARDQIDDPSLDLVAEYVAMRDAALVLRDWIFANLPRDPGSGAVLIETVGNDGERTELTVSVAAAAGFRAEADAFIATIE